MEDEMLLWYCCENMKCPDTEDYTQEQYDEFDGKCPTCGEPLAVIDEDGDDSEDYDDE
jgi:Zn finger protein HypA/HybF involved in hydrogenase expression